MKLRLSEATEFRGKKYGEGRKADIPDGVAFKLIGAGKAEKISDDEFEAFDMDDALESANLNDLKVDELKEICKNLNLSISGNKDDLVGRIEEEFIENAKKTSKEGDK